MANTPLPPMLAEASKFNRSNWVAWKGLVTIAANLRSAFGYLDGSTPRPSPIPQSVPLPASPTTANTMTASATTPTSTTLPESSWESTTPSLTEWKVRDAWALGLLVYNTIDPVGLGINISGVDEIPRVIHSV
jgi:hypothetical protein